MDKRTLFLFGFLPLLFFLAIIFFSVCNSFNSFGGDGKGSFKIIKTLESPGGKYVAVFWNGMGGGAAGWCRQYINIYKKEESFDLAKVEENRTNKVFDARCDSDAEMSWKSVNHLHITSIGAEEAVNVLTDGKTEDGKINISYEIK